MGYYYGAGDPGFFSWLGKAAKGLVHVVSQGAAVVGQFVPGIGPLVSRGLAMADGLLNPEAQPTPEMANVGADQAAFAAPPRQMQTQQDSVSYDEPEAEEAEDEGEEI